jgi:hypothetical protein
VNDDRESDEVSFAETQPVPGFELDALRGWMIDGAYDEDDDGPDAIEIGRGALDTIPLPPDELERLLVLTRGAIGLEGSEDAARGRKDRLVTLMSAQPAGHLALRSTPIPATPRTMRGVEILLGAPLDSLDGASDRHADSDRPTVIQRGPLWRFAWKLAPVAAAAALVPLIVVGLRSSVFRSQARPDAPLHALVSPALSESGIEGSVEPRSLEEEGTAFTEARAALIRLRSGILSCARESIGVLPGTSPPVPSSLRLAKGDGYVSAPRDWVSPVWSCAGFSMPDPQRFQIQWQMVKTNVEGLGVAWIDDDEDGVPDRALGFRATLKDRGQPEAGDIEPLDPEVPLAHIVR